MQGISYPLQLNGNGGLELKQDDDLVQSLIFSFFETYPLENPMRPKYGFNSELFTSQQRYDPSINLANRLAEFIPNTAFEVRTQINDSGERELLVYWQYNNNPRRVEVLSGWN